jgi:hypothetical protein
MISIIETIYLFHMKKILLATALLVIITGCTTSSLPKRIIEAGNDGRIQQYLEENILDTKTAVCNFEWLNQPNANVVEVWALCEEFIAKKDDLKKREAASLPVKITFANPSLHIIPADGSEYMTSIEKSFSDIAVEKIKNEERNILELEAKNLIRAKKWLIADAPKNK